MDTPSEDRAIAQQLMDRHFDIWNERDADARLAQFAAVYTPAFFVADYAAKASGYAEVNQLIARVQSEHAGFSFRPEPITWNHGLGRATWGYGPAENPNLVRGEDIFTMDQGKLASMHVFLDGKPSA